MGYFASEEEVYRFIGRLFEELVEDPDLGPRFQNANTVVQYQLRAPDAQITVQSLKDEPLRVDLGPTDLDPEVIMSMEADVAHRFWLGKVNLTAALARGEIMAKGPVAKILRLVPLVKPSFPRYQELLRQGGRNDLVEVD